MNGFSVSVCSVIWFYVVVIFPSKIYNFHKLEPLLESLGKLMLDGKVIQQMPEK